MRTLCTEWVREQHPLVYRQFKMKAAQEYTLAKTGSAQLQLGEAKVHVSSLPSGGEIYVDGKFFGNTPSDITLTAGEYAFKVTMGGKEWSRSVQITSGEIRIHAEMVAP